MVMEEHVKERLAKSYSVPKDILEEATDVGGTDSVLTSISNEDILSYSSKTHQNHDKNIARRQHRYHIVNEKMAKLDGSLGTGNETDSAVDYHKNNRISTSEFKSENESQELDRSRDRTPTRDEKKLELELELELGSEKGDKTPPRSEKNRIRKERELQRLNGSERGRKRARSDDENTGVVSKKQSSNTVSDVPVILGIPLTTSNLDQLLPAEFKIIKIPETYKPLNNSLPDFSNFDSLLPASNSLIKATFDENTSLQQEEKLDTQLIYKIPDLKDLQYFNETDAKVFGKLITYKDKKNILEKEKLELRCMKLILKIKNCSQTSRKLALRSLTDNAKTFGPDIIFNIILPLLADPTLDDQSRHLLIKVIGRVMFKLDTLIKPYTEKLLIVTMPLLSDDNKFTRLEGRDVISKLSKIVGLITLINILKPDLASNDEYIRDSVSKTFAVIAHSLGISSLLLFLKAICNSQENWVIRYTGTKIIQQIANLNGSSILPFLNQLIQCLYRSIDDEVLNVRIMTASTISALAEAASPYGYESFQILIDPLFKGMRNQRGKSLAQFIRALSNLIPLMDVENANYYSSEVLKILKREFSSPDDDMKRSILITIDKICTLKYIDSQLIKKLQILRPFFKSFWTRKMSLDQKFAFMCINSLHSLSLKVGIKEVVPLMLPSLKDESESYRRMSLETIEKIIASLGNHDLNDNLVNRLLDGLIYIFQNQKLDNKRANNKVLTSLGAILNNLGIRVKPHLMKIVSSILYRLKNKDSEIREQAADLIVKVLPVIRRCNESDLLVRLCTILYESLGEVYPNVLGSILNALRCVVLSIDSVEELNPSIQQIFSTLTPILKNRHDKVQEMTINLLGDIAERAKDYINYKEWMRISFELLEMLKSHKKSIRKSANKTFGLIAKAIGPSDVLVTLLNNLRVQERQLRVCTAVAIGIVSEVCLPFTVLPALMNEYRYPDKNVQNGVLKAIGFMFEYIGDLGSDYIYAITPLLLDALTDRDLVHRQIASNVVKHISLGSFGSGYEDAFINFLDLIWPNIFETSPHVISQVFESIESLHVVLGSGVLLNYIWYGLFHPAKKVRDSYWRIFNTLYINSSHSMIPFYPRFENIGKTPQEEMESSKGESSKAILTTELTIPELEIWV